MGRYFYLDIQGSSTDPLLGLLDDSSTDEDSLVEEDSSVEEETALLEEDGIELEEEG